MGLFDKYFHSLSIQRTMGIRREEYLDYMTFKSNERGLFIEPFGPLVGLKEEWQTQGASSAELDFTAFRYRQPLYFGVPIKTGWMGGTETLLEETEDFLLARDAKGRRVKLFKKVATLPLPLDYPVRTMDDWLKIKEHYLFSEARLGDNWEASVQKAKSEGKVIAMGMPGGFDEPRQLMGEEALCVAFYEDQELIHDMLETFGATAERLADIVTSKIQVDQLNIHEDLAGKSGPLVGPRQIQEFILPYYRRTWDLMASRGTRLFFQDSDGDMSPVMKDFVEAGINVMSPMEPVGNNDIVKMREIYGTKLAFAGGINKHVLRKSKEAIIAELESKIPIMRKTGGWLMGIDHRIPNGTPIENYRFYVQKVWEILSRTEKMDLQFAGADF